MRPLPQLKLDRKVTAVWRVSELVIIACCWLCIGLPFLIAGIVEDEPALDMVNLVLGIATIVCLVFFVGVFPRYRYERWRFEVGEHELDIMRGIFWRKRFVIPFVRVQNTDTKQGPIMRAFGLAQVTVATAAGEHVIPGLTVEQADELRDAIATQARLAQEDL